MSDTIAERLRLVRELAGLHCRTLSMLAGVAPALVNMIERGKVVAPQAVTVAKLASTLGVSMEWLTVGTGRPPSRRRVREAVKAARAGALRKAA